MREDLLLALLIINSKHEPLQPFIINSDYHELRNLGYLTEKYIVTNQGRALIARLVRKAGEIV